MGQFQNKTGSTSVDNTISNLIIRVVLIIANKEQKCSNHYGV